MTAGASGPHRDGYWPPPARSVDPKGTIQWHPRLRIFRWTLIVIKTLAVTGLIVGIWVPGVGLAANVGVVVYFLCAAASHIMARFTGMSFWVNCLGMLVLSFIVLVLSFSVRGN